MRLLIVFFIFYISFSSFGQYSHDDTLRGSILPERSWWDVQHHHLRVNIQPEHKTISGSNQLVFKTITHGKIMQIDLQAPLKIDSVLYQSNPLSFNQHSKNTWYVMFQDYLVLDQLNTVTIYYSGRPIEAKNAPWDGGIVWSKDELGNDFIASACQGIGASAWWPCKDHGYDEPDMGVIVELTTPKKLMSVSNGRLINDTIIGEERTTKWQVINPINNYGVNFNIGNYTSWDSLYQGRLPMTFYALKQHANEAKKQFKDAFRMMDAFEHWFGPYPFYEDGYKLVEVPYLGMEHQSSVTYGNGFKNGYLGNDLSQTGWGLKWDFIIIHESGHEWFANNITAKDNADLWIHEAFTSYSEAIFTEYHYGKEAGAAYVRGIRANILNDKPLIGNYGVNDDHTTDIYYKGSNLLHTIRQLVHDDTKWRNLLREMNAHFYHQTVDSKDIEGFMSNFLGLSLNSIFDQYLRTKDLPFLKIKKQGKFYRYKWENCIPNFDMPIDVFINGIKTRLNPETKFKKIKAKQVEIDDNYYIKNTIYSITKK